jgi:hypothetical protein
VMLCVCSGDRGMKKDASDEQAMAKSKNPARHVDLQIRNLPFSLYSCCKWLVLATSRVLHL